MSNRFDIMPSPGEVLLFGLVFWVLVALGSWGAYELLSLLVDVSISFEWMP